MAFRGLYEHSLDAKDRLTVPARFRSALADGVVLSKGLDPCVDLYTSDAFERVSDTYLAPHSPFSADARKMRRRFIAESNLCHRPVGRGLYPYRDHKFKAP